MSVKVICVAGARPNFMKVAPLLSALSAQEFFDPKLVHTGQHYDDLLSKIFFEDLNIPKPDRDLEVGSASHAVQTAEIMLRFERVLEEEQPQVVLVVGDVNSTIACTLVAGKFHLAEPFETNKGFRTRPLLVHVEAGLRSFDREMPEELNRILTDALSDLLYVSDPAGLINLEKEGVESERVVFVGNVMIDTLLAAKKRAMESSILEDLSLEEKGFGLVTLHRPSNVDDPKMLRHLISVLSEVAQETPLVFPVHPRTRARIVSEKIHLDEKHWKLLAPIGYLDFLKLTATAKLVLTDSGGIQEETTVLGVPCITLRENTERPVTIEEGTNFLAGTNREKILKGVRQAIDAPPQGRIPRFWDGKSAQRIANHLASMFPTS
ncbi:MAG: UDP-N-acetylglucosamine 2-epimerase (non-hydrolyzing) [Pseudomonadota bacterium]